jgi:serine/threonine-protein kinase
MAVIVAVVIVVVLNHSDKPDAGPTSPVSLSPSVTPDSAPATTPANSASFTPDQQTLTKDLPSTYTADECKGASVPSSFHAAAEIVCGAGTSSTGPTSAAFLMYTNVTTLRSDFATLMSQENVAASSDNCPAVGFRSFHFDDNPSVTVGSMASFIETDSSSNGNSAVIAWTNEPDDFFGIAFNTGGESTLGDMCTWWQNN